MWGALIGAGAGILGDILGGNAQSGAANAAAQAQIEAARMNIEAARENRDYTAGLYNPTLRQGDRASAYSQAATYGTPQTYSGAANVDPVSFVMSNPDLKAMADAEAAQTGRPARDVYASFGQAWLSAPQNQPYLAERGLGSETITPDTIRNIAESSPLAAYNEEDLAANYGLADEAYGADMALAGDERSQAEAEALRRRGDVEGVARTDFDRTLGYLGEDLDRRTAYTDAALAGRARNLERDKERADAYANALFAGTGLGGASERTRVEAQNELNDDFATTERGWRLADYDPYSTGRLAAQSVYGSRLYDTAGVYGDDVNNARGIYYDRANPATQRRSAGRQAAYSNYSGNRYSAYGDTTAGFRTDQARGDAARANIAGANNVYTNTVTNQNTNAGAAAAGAAYARGQAAANAYGSLGDFGGAVGGVYDEYVRNRKPKTYATKGY